MRSGLGSDNTICKGEMVAAVLQRVQDFQPPVLSQEDFDRLAAPLQDPSGNSEVQRNLGAIGEGVRQILVRDAAVFSDAGLDAGFFGWLSSIQTWVTQMRAWQEQVNKVLTTLKSSGSVPSMVSTEIDRLPAITAPPPTSPSALSGAVR